MIRIGKQDWVGAAADRHRRAGRDVGIKGGWRGLSAIPLGALFLAMNMGSAHAATGFLSGMKVTGDVRAYDFARFYTGVPPSQHAFAAGGAVNIMSGAVDGFSATASQRCGGWREAFLMLSPVAQWRLAARITARAPWNRNAAGLLGCRLSGHSGPGRSPGWPS